MSVSAPVKSAAPLLAAASVPAVVAPKALSTQRVYSETFGAATLRRTEENGKPPVISFAGQQVPAFDLDSLDESTRESISSVYRATGRGGMAMYEGAILVITLNRDKPGFADGNVLEASIKDGDRHVIPFKPGLEYETARKAVYRFSREGRYGIVIVVRRTFANDAKGVKVNALQSGHVEFFKPYVKR